MENDENPEYTVNNTSAASDTEVSNYVPVPGVEPARKHSPFTMLRRNFRRYWAVLALTAYLTGIASGFMLWGRSSDPEQAAHADMQDMAAQINPPNGYEIPASFGDIGPKLVDAGAIDLDRFTKIYEEIGKPLSDEQIDVLRKGDGGRVVINQDNQQFLLNFLWAFGLANQNRVLTEGPMMSRGKANVVNFASTGGWTLSAKPIPQIYAASQIVSLTEEQQQRLEELAQGVYRPCCDNPTHFPDCNHGMAMLGLLELMASQDATSDQMYEAAKYVNAYWFPQQTLEIAIAYKVAKKLNFEQTNAREVVGRSNSSGSGFQAVHQFLAQNGQLGQVPQGGGGCGVK